MPQGWGVGCEVSKFILDAMHYKLILMCFV